MSETLEQLGEIVELDRLAEEVGDRQLVLSIVRVFIAEGERRIQEIEAAARAGDITQTRFLAHALKGSARNFGLPCLVASCANLEVVAAAPVAGLMVESAAVVARCFADAVVALKHASRALSVAATSA